MNHDGELRSWGDPVFARKLVEFAKIEVIPNPSGIAGVLARLTDVFGPPPYTDFGTRGRRRTTRPTSPAGSPRASSAPSADPGSRSSSGGRRPRRTARTSRRRSWAARAATRARRRATRPPARASACRARPASTSPTSPTSRRTCATFAPSLTEEQIQQLQLDYEGRIGSLLAVDDHVKRLVDTLRATDQLENTLIVFLSDNGWLQGEHRIPGDKFLPYDESLRVPLIMRGPGVPAGRDRARAGLEHRLRPDAAGRRPGQGGAHDRRRVARADAPRRARASRPGPADRGAAAAVRGPRSRQPMGPAVQGRAHRPLHVRRLHRDRRAGAVRPSPGPRPAAQRRRRARATRASRRRLAARLERLDDCKGRTCDVRP